MNNVKRKFFSISIIIAVLFVTSCGGYETVNNGTGTINEGELNEIETDEGETSPSCPVPLRISINSETNLKEKLVEQVDISKTIQKEIELSKSIGNEDKVLEQINEETGERYGSYLMNKIMDIQGFYSLDDFNIDGYELYLVTIGEYDFEFRFGPADDLENQSSFTSNMVFNIRIVRPESWFGNSSLEEVYESWLEQAVNDNSGYLTEDNMIYYEKHSDIAAIMGNTILTIKVPEKLNTYEYLRELALQVIEKAELVTVD